LRLGDETNPTQSGPAKRSAIFARRGKIATMEKRTARGLRNPAGVRHTGLNSLLGNGTTDMPRTPLLLVVLSFCLATVAYAQGGDRTPPAKQAQARPELFEALVRCRAVSVDAERLQCFDAAAAALEQATERRELVVVDRAQVRESRRRLFGLALPSLPIFGGGDDGRPEEEEVTSIESTVVSSSQDGLGHWAVRLADGSLWIQTDNRPLAFRPRPGQPVVVNKAALGSYMMRVNNQPGIRVRRQL
jgi:hypothetical protein